MSEDGSAAAADTSQAPAFRSATFQLGPLDVVLEGNDQALITQCELLLDGFEQGTRSHVSTVLTITKASDTPGERYRASIAGQPAGSASSARDIELVVTRLLNRAVLDAEPDLLHLHAGAVHRQGITALVIGSSMAGKSTLVAKLVEQGWQYLSDEQIAVHSGGELVRFPRAITLRRASWPLFDLVFPQAAGATDRVEVAPRVLGQVYSGAAVVPDLIIRPDVSEAESVVERLSVAHALAVLIEDSLDLERAGPDGIAAMVAITAAAPAYRVAGQDLAQTLRSIDELCVSVEAPGAVVAHDRVPTAEESERVPGSMAWIFADRSSALYEPVTGALVRQDEAGFVAWAQLAAPLADWAEQMRTSDYVHNLRQAGLLKPTPA